MPQEEHVNQASMAEARGQPGSATDKAGEILGLSNAYGKVSTYRKEPEVRQSWRYNSTEKKSKSLLYKTWVTQHQIQKMTVTLKFQVIKVVLKIQ